MRRIQIQNVTRNITLPFGGFGETAADAGHATVRRVPGEAGLYSVTFTHADGTLRETEFHGKARIWVTQPDNASLAATVQTCTGACAEELPIRKFPTTTPGAPRATECRACRDARLASGTHRRGAAKRSADAIAKTDLLMARLAGSNLLISVRESA